MARFVVVHPVGKELTMETGAPTGRAIKAALTPEAYWVRSTYLREEGKLYCEWDAVDAAAIRRVLTKATPSLPTEGIYKVDLAVNGEEYR